MSIESLLTTGAATAILAVAVALRLVVLSTARLILRMSPRDARPVRERPRKQRRPAAREPIRPRLAQSSRSVGASLSFVAGAVAKGVRVTATGLLTITLLLVASAMRGIERGATSLRPRLAAGGRASWQALVCAWGWLMPRLVIAVATLQHLTRRITERSREWLSRQQEQRGSRPGEAASAGPGPRVIELNDDWDPLTDEFPEDRLTSSR